MTRPLLTQLNQVSDTIAAEMVGSGDPLQVDPFSNSNVISEASSHDFTSYQFALEPALRSEARAGMTDEEYEVFRVAIRGALRTGVPEYIGFSDPVPGQNHGGVVDHIWAPWNDPLYEGDPFATRLMEQCFLPLAAPYWLAAAGTLDDTVRARYLSEVVVVFRAGLDDYIGKIDWGDLTQDLSALPLANKGDYEALFTDTVELWVNAMIGALDNAPRPEIDNMASASRTGTFGSGMFQPFKANTVNFGLQLVYRQVWKPTGTQMGDIVRTIPLGPGQSERVVIKTVRRQQLSRSTNNTVMEESSESASTSTRDSAEVVSEASKSFNWNTEVSAEASWGWGKASVSGGMGGESASSSRDTKSTASEAMQKTAHKMRTETKIVISSEREATDSIERTSEITNANEETAVTYVYSKLQRQYEVYTYLAEVNTVAYVAERVVSHVDVTPDWLRDNATELRRALLDPDLAVHLDRVVTRSFGPIAEPQSEAAFRDDRIARMMDKLATFGLPDHSSTAGSPPDTVTSTLAQYQADRAESRQRYEAYWAYRNSLGRIRAHIVENALHYSKAIWMAEAPDMRMLRYRNLLVPREWEQMNAVGNGYRRSDVSHPPLYVPVLDGPNALVPLTDVISPAGPVGMAGNYLVYDVKESHQISHIDAPLALMRQAYTQKRIWFDATGNVSVTAALSGRYLMPKERLEIRIKRQMRDAPHLIQILARDEASGRATIISSDLVSVYSDGRFYGKTLSGVIHGQLEEGETISGGVVLTSALEDPDFAQVRFEQIADVAGRAPSVLTGNVLDALSQRYPSAWAQIGVSAQMPVEDWPHDVLAEVVELYLSDQFVSGNTRGVLLDTDNVILQRVVDNASSLEPYKSAHRKIDLLRTIEEVSQELSETDRRMARLASGDLSDPDIDTRISVDEGADISVTPTS